MYNAIKRDGVGAIKLTLSVSHFTDRKRMTLSLLEYEEDRREHRLSSGVQKLREKFGLDIVKTGNEM